MQHKLIKLYRKNLETAREDNKSQLSSSMCKFPKFPRLPKSSIVTLPLLRNPLLQHV